MKAFTFLLLATVLLLGFSLISFAEFSSKNQVQKQHKAANKSSLTKNNKTSRKTAPKKFIPTEKIKADISVPFPVDI